MFWPNCLIYVFQLGAYLSFGRSYTVPILKDKNAVFSKTIPVDDFRGISISPVISKVFEHCIDRFGDYFLTSDNQFSFKKQLSFSHAIYTLRCVVDAYVNSGSTVNIMCSRPVKSIRQDEPLWPVH